MVKTSRNAVRLIATACLLFVITLSYAAVPAALNYTGLSH
jgi:hypothetical protein